MCDVVTTSIYRYARLARGNNLVDRTLALRHFSGKGQSRSYPDGNTLLRFGQLVCRVKEPANVIRRIAAAMSDTLAQARQDDRIPKATLNLMANVWAGGMAYASATRVRPQKT